MFEYYMRTQLPYRRDLIPVAMCAANELRITLAYPRAILRGIGFISVDVIGLPVSKTWSVEGAREYPIRRGPIRCILSLYAWKRLIHYCNHPPKPNRHAIASSYDRNTSYFYAIRISYCFDEKKRTKCAPSGSRKHVKCSAIWIRRTSPYIFFQADLVRRATTCPMGS